MLFVSMPDALDLSFAQFWALYPRREAKKDARKAWHQLRPSEAVVTEILAALAWQVTKPQWLKDGGQYVPLPASWIRGERWTDERPQTLSASATLEIASCPQCGTPGGRCVDVKICNANWLAGQRATAERV